MGVEIDRYRKLITLHSVTQYFCGFTQFCPVSGTVLDMQTDTGSCKCEKWEKHRVTKGGE